MYEFIHTPQTNLHEYEEHLHTAHTHGVECVATKTCSTHTMGCEYTHTEEKDRRNFRIGGPCSPCRTRRWPVEPSLKLQFFPWRCLYVHEVLRRRPIDNGMCPQTQTEYATTHTTKDAFTRTRKSKECAPHSGIYLFTYNSGCLDTYSKTCLHKYNKTSPLKHN